MTPERWAFDLTKVLRAFDADCYPIDVEKLAREYSAQRFPDDAVTAVRGGDIEGFEGMLKPAPRGRSGWGIFYNDTTTEGRQRFTIAHEFGHYLLHRLDFPDGIECSTEDMFGQGAEYREVERQANLFAATLLMPLDHFRERIDANSQPDWNDLAKVAQLYGVSLLACCHRWMEYTSSRSCLVTSRDGYILTSRSTDAAFRSGLYFKTKNVVPVAVPSGTLTAMKLAPGGKHSVSHRAGVWLPEACVECTVSASAYDTTYTLLHCPQRSNISLTVDAVEDMVDRFLSS